jgi:hypothetical protein
MTLNLCLKYFSIWLIFIYCKYNRKEKYVPSDTDMPHFAIYSAFFYNKSAAKFEDKKFTTSLLFTNQEIAAS